MKAIYISMLLVPLYIILHSAPILAVGEGLISCESYFYDGKCDKKEQNDIGGDECGLFKELFSRGENKFKGNKIETEKQTQSHSGEWIEDIDKEFSGGNGLTKETAFEIKTAQQLAYLALKTNNEGSEKFYHYKLINDIDLSRHYWNPIGNEKHKFYGSFDGNGHVIWGLMIDRPYGNCQGLFGKVKGGSKISNLEINNFYIRADFSIGAIVGDGMSVEIRRCKVGLGSVYGNFNFVGSIIGNASCSQLYDCSAENVLVKGHSLVGYFFGNSNSVASYQCNYNYVTVLGDKNYNQNLILFIM